MRGKVPLAGPTVPAVTKVTLKGTSFPCTYNPQGGATGWFHCHGEETEARVT